MLQSILSARQKFVDKVVKIAIWIAFLISVAYSLILPFVAKHTLFTWLVVGTALLYMLGLILYHRYPKTIKILFILIFNTDLFFCGIILGSTSTTVMTYFISITLISIIFNSQEYIYRFSLAFFTVACVLLLEFSHYTLFGLVENMYFGENQATILAYSRYVGIFTSYIIVIITLYFSNKNLYKIEDKLHQIVLELLETRTSLEVQNDLKNALEELQASKEQLRENFEMLQSTQENLIIASAQNQAITTALDNSAIVSVANLEGKIVKVNDMFCKVSGYTETELLGKDHSIINSGHHTKEFWSEMWQTITTGHTWRAEVCNKAKNEALYWVDTIINPVYDAEGRIYQYLAIRTLVTERKEAEQALLASEKELKQNLEELQTTQEVLALQERKFRHLFEGSNDAIMLLNMAGFTDCNATTLKMFDISREQFTNTHPGVLSPEFQPNGRLSKDFADEKIAEALQNGYARFEWTHKKYTGECFEAEVLLSPYQSISGLIIQATVRDITERKRIEQQIRQLSIVAEKVMNGVVITDHKQRITWVNKGFERMTGYKLDELKGKNPNVLQGKDTNPAHRQRIKEKILERKPFTQIILNYHKDGTPYWCEITITPIFSEAGEIEQFIGIEQDVTMREEAQTKLEILSNQVQAQNNELQNSLAQVIELRQKSEKARIESELLLDKITQSIHYAQRIQDAIIPKETELQKYIDCFVFFRPRDIVSGDFYWFANKENKKILVVADCTGHGVPGAFMTIIGNNLLNQIIHDKEVHTPAQILHCLQVSLRQTLAGDNRSIKDGMDIAIITVEPLQEIGNTHQVIVEYAGAINPLHYTEANDEVELKVIKANKIFIGDEIRETDKFTNHTLHVQKGQVIYLASDGYQDQFGGQEDKKFRVQNFRSLLANISSKQMQEQKEILAKTFEDWKGRQEQTDDVLVVGVKV